MKLSQVFELAFACGHPYYMCTFSYSISSFQSTLHLIYFDTALIEQPPLSVMTLCDLPSLWRVSMIIFWTIANSAVFPIITSTPDCSLDDGVGRHVSFHPPPIPLVYTVNLIGVDPSMCIPLLYDFVKLIWPYYRNIMC